MTRVPVVAFVLFSFAVAGLVWLAVITSILAIAKC